MRFDWIDNDMLRRALRHAEAGPSSDYDLNPEVQAALRADRSMAEADRDGI